MNYLAHAYLSFGRPAILLGNMVSDFVRGRKKFDFPEEILFGINLHRSIDDFTDNHQQTRDAKKIYEDEYGLYSGAFMDISYDYFLANDQSIFPGRELGRFSTATYNQLEDQIEFFPMGFASMFPYMKKHDWLLNYKEEAGIKRSFEGLVHRAKYMDDSSAAFKIFLSNKPFLQNAYNSFFPDLVHFTKDALERSQR